MSFNVAQFKTLIERVLSELDPDLASPVAVKLLLGTAAQESRFGTFLHQLGGGPAKGAFQMEPATFEATGPLSGEVPRDLRAEGLGHGVGFEAFDHHVPVALPDCER